MIQRYIVRMHLTGEIFDNLKVGNWSWNAVFGIWILGKYACLKQMFWTKSVNLTNYRNLVLAKLSPQETNILGT